MKHDPIFVMLSSALAFTFDSTKFFGVFSQRFIEFDAEVEIFTLVSVLFIPCLAVSVGVSKFSC